MINKSWKINDQEVARVSIDDSRIVLEVDNEVNGKFGKEIQELQNLNMFPPLDENKIAGEKIDNDWTKYAFRKGANWERAKEEIIKTLDFWLGEIQPPVVIM